MYHILFARLLVDRHLGCFHLLAFVNKAAVSTSVQICLQDLVLHCFGHIPQSGIAGSHGTWIYFREEPT